MAAWKDAAVVEVDGMTELAVREKPELVRLTNEQLHYIAGTEFVPRDLRGNMPAILACIATGRALGVADMTALRSIHVIDGRPTFSAELMVMLARQRGHSIQGEVTDGQATVRGRRADNGDEMSVTWTMAMAERAGLSSKGNWRKYPEAMLWARAVSQLCRELFADVFAGATYTPEELEDSVGEPEPGAAHPQALAGADEDPSSPVSQPVLDGDEAASPTEADAGEGESLHSPEGSAVDASRTTTPSPAEPVDLSDPDIPFGDAPPDPPKPTKAQLKKLDVMVKSKLVNHPAFSLERVYTTVASERGWTRQELENTVGGRDEDGVLHWTPLRAVLSKHEAHVLIDKLEALEATA